jgi:hypothetical protein
VEDAHLIGRCTQLRVRDCPAGTLKNGLPAHSGLAGMVPSPRLVSTSPQRPASFQGFL